MITRLSALACLILAAGCQTSRDPETRPQGDDALSAAESKAALGGQVDFARHVKPILEERCFMCHNGSALPRRMDLSSAATARKTGALGGFIVPGHPEQSLFVSRIGNAPAHLKAMPPVGQQLTATDRKVLERWIAQGAVWPAGPEGQLRQ